jgi:hypothetical protein
MRFTLGPQDSRAARITKRVLLALFLLHVPVWISSSYRAWVQVYRLDLEAPARLAPGAVIRAAMATPPTTGAPSTATRSLS